MLDNAIPFVYVWGEVKTMSEQEPKNCPYLLAAWYGSESNEDMDTECWKDKCAMWRDTKCIGSDSSNLYVKGEFGWGYCGLAGKP